MTVNVWGFLTFAFQKLAIEIGAVSYAKVDAIKRKSKESHHVQTNKGSKESAIKIVIFIIKF